jgi:hypothetical protein
MGAGSISIELPDGPLALPIEVMPDPAEAAETRDIQPDPALLAEVAAASGGVALRLDEIDRVPDVLRAVAESAARQPAVLRRVRLWDSPATVLALAALLCLEWALRREVGLP